MGDVRKRNLKWERWILDTPEAMCECLRELMRRGWDESDTTIRVDRGSIRASLNADSMPIWLLEIGTDRPLDPVLANLGNVIVRIGTRLESLSLQEYQDVYGDNE